MTACALTRSEASLAPPRVPPGAGDSIAVWRVIRRAAMGGLERGVKSPACFTFLLTKVLEKLS